MRPRLKGVVWQREGRHLRLVYDIRDHFLLADPDGTVEGCCWNCCAKAAAHWPNWPRR
jgi:hypothetical protein